MCEQLQMPSMHNFLVSHQEPADQIHVYVEHHIIYYQLHTFVSISYIAIANCTDLFETCLLIGLAV